MRGPLIVVLAVAPLCVHAQAPDTAPNYARDIQPIFAKNCYACHGEKMQSGGLRLDQKQSVIAKIVPGKHDDSELYRRVSGHTDKARMPMGGRLSDAEIAAIAQWIDATPKTKHWAFVPPVRPVFPLVTNTKWSRNPIDRFVLAKLESEGLKPSPEANRATLLRRLSLDLIGLPPTPAEVDAFVNDRSASAYEKQVDRLLASLHYGERWARPWLDGARYADSDGYEKDQPRFVWFYRDWVINALNKNLPYNEFVIDQIAGDLLPNATQDQKVATGFLRNSMINEEGGVDPEQFRMEAMFDRMDAIGKGVLGVTIQCAQCHNHKYDPLTQEEYYRMFAFLNNSNESNIAVYSPDQQMRIAAILRRTRDIEGALQRRTPDWRTRMAKWEESVAHDQPDWVVVRPEVDDLSTDGSRYIPQDDGSLLAQGYAPVKLTVKLIVKTSMKDIRAFRLELMNDPNLPLGGPGRSIKGTGALTEFTVEAGAAGSAEKPAKVRIDHATADINLPAKPLESRFYDKSDKQRLVGPIEFAIDGKDETAWNIDAGPGLRNSPRKAVFNAAKPISNSGDTVLIFSIGQRAGGWNANDNQNNNLGRIRLSITNAENAVADPLPAGVRAILGIPRDKRNALQEAKVFSYWRTTVPEWKNQHDAIVALWREYPEGSSQLVLDERGQLRPTHQLVRGDFLTPGKEVAPGVPSFLNSLPADAAANRLTFAKWLVSRDSPTTARAFVNRLWLQYFGTGIVETAEDFGTQSSPPSHPELLDWLAVEFMDRKWDIKAMQRLIVTAATYRQSSNVTPELLAKDPYNRLLARGPRFRVDAEIVRDIALEASGLLDEKVGGPSVHPPAPAFLFLPPASFGTKNWTTEQGSAKYRRALYTFRFRTSPYPALQTFDSPNGESSCVRRARSNTPLQALTTLNEPLFLDAARALAVATIENGGPTDRQKLNYAARRVLSRRPSEEEAAVLLGLLKKEQQRFSESGDGAAAFQPAVLRDATPAQAAAWTTVARVLLNLDEAITKE